MSPNLGVLLSNAVDISSDEPWARLHEFVGPVFGCVRVSVCVCHLGHSPPALLGWQARHIAHGSFVEYSCDSRY